jgi:hypothetical protein
MGLSRPVLTARRTSAVASPKISKTMVMHPCLAVVRMAGYSSGDDLPADKLKYRKRLTGTIQTSRQIVHSKTSSGYVVLRYE